MSRTVPLRPKVLVHTRRSHFLTVPPSMPARPHPAKSGEGDFGIRRYGWGDWFVASVISSVVAWPAVFAIDSLWAEVLFPLVEKLNSGNSEGIVGALGALSLLPKAGASYMGAHLYVPRAWWFWKLSLLPAFPVSLTVSLAMHALVAPAAEVGAGGSEVTAAAPEGSAAASESKVPKVVSMAWRPSRQEKKAVTERLREAAPTFVQVVLNAIR